jgi:hypothetical protein
MELKLHNQIYMHKICSSEGNQSTTCFEMSQVLTSGNANSSHSNVLKMVLGTDGENTAGF